MSAARDAVRGDARHWPGRMAGVARAMSIYASLALATSSAALHAQTSDPQAPPARFERSVELAGAGWHRVALPAEMRARMQPDARDLRLIAPDGRQLPYRLIDRPSPPPTSVTARLVDVIETELHWQLIIDLGPDRVAHQRLHFDLVNPDLVARVRIHAADSIGDWQVLGEAPIFRLGSATTAQRSSIDYPPTEVRYLRVDWPRSAGLPELRDLRVDPLPVANAAPEVERLPLTFEIDQREPGRVGYRIEWPGAGLTSADWALRWTGVAGIGYRLLQPIEGRWQLLAEGELAPAGEDGWAEIGLLEPPTAEILRLQIHGGGQTRPRLEAAELRLPARELVFDAPEEGRYHLSYGGIGLAAPDYPAAGLPTEIWTLPRIQPSAERSLGWPALPRRPLAPGAELPEDLAPEARWPLDAEDPAEGLAAGDLVELELPAPLLSRIGRTGLTRLRLVSAGRQLPYVAGWRALPVELVALDGLRSEAGDSSGYSRLQVDLPLAHLPLTELELLGPAEPFRRSLAWSWPPVPAEDAPERFGLPTPAPIQGGAALWTCPGYSLLPCRLVQRIESNPSRRLELRFEDGDNPPLSSVDLRIRRAAYRLRFAWPAAGDVELWLMPGGGAPSYDLELSRQEVLARPARALRVASSAIPETSEEATGLSAPQQRALLLVMLLLASGGLLWLLARLLRQVGPAGDAAT